MESTIRDGRYGPGMTRVAIAGVAALGVLASEPAQARAEPVRGPRRPGAGGVGAGGPRCSRAPRARSGGDRDPGAGAAVAHDRPERLRPRRQAGPRAADRDCDASLARSRSTSRCRRPGRHHNVTRYPVAIVGGGFRGILDSPSTRLPGLVSIADVAPTAVALEQGTKPVLGFRPGNAAVAARSSTGG